MKIKWHILIMLQMYKKLGNEDQVNKGSPSWVNEKTEILRFFLHKRLVLMIVNLIAHMHREKNASKVT